MSKLYDDVKKQGVQIDDLQKNLTNHNTRIETLETKVKATPPSQSPTVPYGTAPPRRTVGTTPTPRAAGFPAAAGAQ